MFPTHFSRVVVVSVLAPVLVWWNTHRRGWGTKRTGAGGGMAEGTVESEAKNVLAGERGLRCAEVR